MATRHLIERLSERIDALAARLMPSRTFVAYVRNGLNEEAEIAAFREKHGVTDHDLLIVWHSCGRQMKTTTVRARFGRGTAANEYMF
jgi:hypothetical protein